MNALELILRASERELSAVEAASQQRLALPLAFWRELAEGLRSAGYPQLAAALERAVSAAQARERLLAEKLQCMEPAYDPAAQARCQTVLEEDLRPEPRA
ncbi:MAG: hypothetical protein N2507_05860 [Candidatus Bipolaricaulota bacterium]|nr:hypothetical protein [Candidatus Bipolaricaulota bacterium]